MEDSIEIREFTALVECENCGSVHFCIEKDLISKIDWVVCRNCDNTYGQVA